MTGNASVPMFHPNEIVLGDHLGSGSHNDVYALDSINLLRLPEHLLSIHLQRLRDHIAKHSHHVAIKFLNDTSRVDEDQCQVGAMDLVNEFNLLTTDLKNHPNIIRLVGSSKVRSDEFLSNASQVEGAFFLLLEKLDNTLTDQILEWEMEEQRIARQNASLPASRRQVSQLTLLEARLHAVICLSSAMVHLHERRILYRDWKSDNIGFDKFGQLKMFDFGMAEKVLDQEDKSRYLLSGYLGDPKYMSPELHRFEPYGFDSDVYSYGALASDMLGPSWSRAPGVSSILRASRHVDRQKRPTIAQVHRGLSKCYQHVQQRLDDLTVMSTEQAQLCQETT